MTSQSNNNVAGLGNRVAINLAGIVQKIIRGMEAGDPEKVQIVVRGAEGLCREIRLDNLFQDQEGNFANLKAGDEVEITIATKTQKTQPEQENS